MSERAGRDFLKPFKVALGGVAHTFRTQRHMRFHMYVVLIVFLLGLFMNFGLRENLILLFTVGLVMISEMFNSAIEATVDLVQPGYSPKAKFAKDIAAGAVLITTILAIVVGLLLILGEERWEQIRANMASESLGVGIVQRLVIGLFAVFVAVVIGKGLGPRGEVLRGGLVSGHSAFAFFLAMAAVLVSESALVAAIAILLAAIVAQSRWEAKIHSIVEISLGAAVGTLLGLLLFGIAPK